MWNLFIITTILVFRVSAQAQNQTETVAIILEKSHQSYIPGEIAVFSCNATGNPDPGIYWILHGLDSPTPQILNSINEHQEGTSRNSTIRFQVKTTGYLICSARNELGFDSDKRRIVVTDKYGPLEKPNCGFVEKEDAEKEMFPWVVQIISSDNYGSKWYHAGSLISARHVLTSAQVSDGVYTPSQVGLGDPADRKWVGVEKTSQHPRYDYDEGYDYDIAVIRLEEDVEFTRFIQPICLPAPSEVFGANFVGKELLFAKMEQDCEDHLKVAPTIKVMEKASCLVRMNNTICTSRFDTRRYNIGGPFMYIHTDTYYYHLSLYTEARTIPDTIAYLDWIKSELN